MVGLSLILNHYFDSSDKMKYDSSYSPEFDKPNAMRYILLFGFIGLFLFFEYYLYKVFWKKK